MIRVDEIAGAGPQVPSTVSGHARARGGRAPVERGPVQEVPCPRSSFPSTSRASRGTSRPTSHARSSSAGSPGDGKYTKLCSKYLEEQLGVQRVLLTTSCTHRPLRDDGLVPRRDGRSGGRIVPWFTFVSCVNAFVLRGAKPVFADVRPDTLNIDETKLEERITAATKAIVVVHYAGVGAEMDTILEIAARPGGAVKREDNAHGLFGRYRDKLLGTFRHSRRSASTKRRTSLAARAVRSCSTTSRSSTGRRS